MKRNSRHLNLELARRMRAQGVPLEIEEDDCEFHEKPIARLSISQNGMSFVKDLDISTVGYIIDLRIVHNFSWPFEISSINLELPWRSSLFLWLPDPLETEAHSGMYRLPGSDPFGYPRKQAINHFVGTGRRLYRGCSLMGLLLGIGSQMPDDIPSYGSIAAILHMRDQIDEEYTAPLTLLLDRSEKLHRQNQPKRPRESLFDCPDPCSGITGPSSGHRQDEASELSSDRVLESSERT